MRRQHMNNKPKIDPAIKIIVIDDDDVDAQSIERSLRSADVNNEIIRAYDGIDALDLLKGANGKEKLTKPYILLIDLMMPRMDGITFIKTLRFESDITPEMIFVLSGTDSDEQCTQAYDLNITGFIKKDRAGRDFLRLTKILEQYYEVIERDKNTLVSK